MKLNDIIRLLNHRWPKRWLENKQKDQQLNSFMYQQLQLRM